MNQTRRLAAIFAADVAGYVISTYKCSHFRTEFAADSPLEGTGFEPSVPLLRKALLGVANRRRRHERRSHLQVQVGNGNACLEWLPTAFPSRRDREFESVFLHYRWNVHHKFDCFATI
jgi:hypothetical protein